MRSRAPDSALIWTKLLPPVQREVIPRTAALDLLLPQPGRRLILIRAPAGWGKSSLLQSWGAQSDNARKFAWLALDAGDNDPVRFFAHLIESLHSLSPDVGVRSIDVLKAPGVSLVDDLLPVLLGELEIMPGASILVLDDYHLIDSAEVHEAVDKLIELLPPRLEIAVSTRTEPPLSLARYRGRGQLTEIATRELRFTVDDAQALLNGKLDLELGPAEVERLTERTEGWPAGLYLAALSLRGREHPEAFINDFAGDDRHLVDYLTTEVLEGQCAEIRDFLLRTSFLGRFNASLCDAVTSGNGSAALLRQIERSNLFLVPLDDRRRWYRYHHLFAELLRTEARAINPGAEPEVHEQAANWMLAEGLKTEAVTHLLQAKAFDEAIDLIAESWYPIAASGGQSTVQHWLDQLPREQREKDVRLCVARALVAISLGRLDEVEPALESIREAPAAQGRFHDGFESGQQAEVILRSAYRWLLGDLSGCRETAQDALLSGGPRSGWDSLARIRLGASRFWLGERAEGISDLELGRAGSRLSGLNPAWISSLGLLAMIRAEEGDAETAIDLIAESLATSNELGLAEYWIVAPTHLAQGTLTLAEGRIDEAIAQLNRGLQLASRGSGPIETAYGQVRLAQAHRLRSNAEEATRMLAEARWTVEASVDPGPVISSLLEQETATLSADGSSPAGDPFEELSERELSVLRMMSGDLTQREIGDHLFISFNTVKTHSKSIYRKLGVTRRTDAVARARQLGIF